MSLDIFAGCGGLSQGLHDSGVAETRWAVEVRVRERQTDSCIFTTYQGCKGCLFPSPPPVGIRIKLLGMGRGMEGKKGRGREEGKEKDKKGNGRIRERKGEMKGKGKGK